MSKEELLGRILLHYYGVHFHYGISYAGKNVIMVHMQKNGKKSTYWDDWNDLLFNPYRSLSMSLNLLWQDYDRRNAPMLTYSSLVDLETKLAQICI